MRPNRPILSCRHNINILCIIITDRRLMHACHISIEESLHAKLWRKCRNVEEYNELLFLKCEATYIQTWKADFEAGEVYYIYATWRWSVLVIIFLHDQLSQSLWERMGKRCLAGFSETEVEKIIIDGIRNQCNYNDHSRVLINLVKLVSYWRGMGFFSLSFCKRDEGFF